MVDLVKPVAWRNFCGGRWYRWPLGFEWLAEWILFFFQRFALIKLVVNGVVAVSIVVGIVLFAFEFNDRETDRAVRRATLLATIVQVATTAENNETQNPAVPIIETLVRQRINLSRLPLPKANLSGAELYRARLYKANLSGASLLRANLYKADLRGADLREANLREANLSEANLSEVDFNRVKNLTQAQLNEACSYIAFSPKNLPEGMRPPPQECKEWGRVN